MATIGIIGGTGLDNPKLLENAKEIEVVTPYGNPSSKLTIGNLKGIDVVLLARHGRKHTINPTNVNYRANIWALKEQGCKYILSITACGSLKKSIKPGDFIFIDQFIDRTTKRTQTFYEKDKVCHIPMADPFCPTLRLLLSESAKKLNIPYHKKGTTVTIEGPRFSTRAESVIYKNVWGADAINMTTVPEVVLARELGMCYAAVAMATDYDCWFEKEVNISSILQVMGNNVENVKKLLLDVVTKINYKECICEEYIKTAVM